VYSKSTTTYPRLEQEIKPSSNESHNLWQNTIGSGLSILMNQAGYERRAHDDGLAFFRSHIVPYMGPYQSQKDSQSWQSFMTDDFSPFEYSWSWETSPKIRYSFEPIGIHAGSTDDPFNRTRPLECAEELKFAIPGSDWRNFELFADSFYEDGSAQDASEVVPGISSPSSIFFAIEIGKETIAKAYLIPVLAEQTHTSRLSVLTESMGRVSTDLPAYGTLEDFIRGRGSDHFGVIGIAVDCIDPSLAKLKIYLRSQDTSLNHICSTLSLDGKVKTWDNNAFNDLWELWLLVLGLPKDYSKNDKLEAASHETSGILYNFDIQPNNSLPDSKLYIPVKHYGKDDRQIARGLVTFLEQHGDIQRTREFLGAIEGLCSYRPLEDGRGLQTYISCAVKNGRLHLTSYISPQLYHRGRCGA